MFKYRILAAALGAPLCFAAPFARAETLPVQRCAGAIVTPVHLQRLGDNYLAVHPTPALGQEIDELFPGDVVCGLGRSGVWVRVQYTREGRGFTGWAHSRYLATVTAAPAPSGGGNNTSVTQQQLQQKQIIINVNPNVSQ